jgi:hypothetical protein
MGKEGIRLVLHALNEEGVKNEDACQAAEYYLENYRFIYQNPEDKNVRLFSFPHLCQTFLTIHTQPLAGEQGGFFKPPF